MQAWAAAATGNSRLTNSDGRRHQGARTGPLFAHAFALSSPGRLVCRSDPDSFDREWQRRREYASGRNCAITQMT
jgi:hypothetical protein